MKYAELLARFNKGEVLVERASQREWRFTVYKMGRDRVTYHQITRLLAEAKPYNTGPLPAGEECFWKTPSQVKGLEEGVK